MKGNLQVRGNLQGRVALVTGGARGLGQVFAARLALDGADVAIADIEDCSETCSLVQSLGRRAFWQRCDIADPQDVHHFHAAMQQTLGACNILVNNAGIYPHTPFDELSWEEWRRIQSINVDSMFLLCKAVVPGMRSNRFGRIVNLSSSMLWSTARDYSAWLCCITPGWLKSGFI